MKHTVNVGSLVSFICMWLDCFKYQRARLWCPATLSSYPIIAEANCVDRHFLFLLALSTSTWSGEVGGIRLPELLVLLRDIPRGNNRSQHPEDNELDTQQSFVWVPYRAEKLSTHRCAFTIGTVFA